MKIRKACEADKNGLSKLHRASIKGLCAGHYTKAQIAAWTGLLEPTVYGQALREKLVLVAEEQGEGFSGMAILDARQAEISAVYVHPEKTGRGIGGALLSALEDAAREGGAAALCLCSTLNATRFYLGHGYTEHGPGLHTLPDGTSLECVRMSKTL